VIARIFSCPRCLLAAIVFALELLRREGFIYLSYLSYNVTSDYSNHYIGNLLYREVKYYFKKLASEKRRPYTQAASNSMNNLQKMPSFCLYQPVCLLASKASCREAWSPHLQLGGAAPNPDELSTRGSPLHYQA